MTAGTHVTGKLRSCQQGTRRNRKLRLGEGPCKPPLRFAPKKCSPSQPAAPGWPPARLAEVACHTEVTSFLRLGSLTRNLPVLVQLTL